MVNIEILSSMIGSISPNLAIIYEIGIIIIISTIFAFIVKYFKQPIIPGYIIAGIIIGPLVFGLIKNQSLIEALSEIGIAFLVFSAGLEIKFQKLKEVGSTIAMAGVLQIIIIFILGFVFSKFFGLSNQACIYASLIVAFSSTMVVVKLLSDKREINSLHGRIIIGVLLIQDIVAVVALMILSSDLSLMSLFVVLIKGIVFAFAAVILSKLINPVLKSSAKTHELMLLTAISFLFLFIIGAFLEGFSLVIGAFFAGVCLANSDFKTEIEGKITPLREFFAVIFFVALGMQLKLISLNYFYLLIGLLVIVLVIKPLITMLLIRGFGYKKSTSFFSGNSLAQTSEFSLVLATLGLGLGHLDKGLFSTLVLLTVLTMCMTVYFIKYEKRLLKIFGFPLDLLNKINSKKENLEFHEDDGKKIVIFGCHRMGSLFVKEFEKNKKDLFVVDYNPDIIKSLINKKVPCIYGDFANEEVFDKINIKKAEMIISTIPDLDDNLVLVKKTRRLNRNALIFVVADRISEALSLYNAGADYVILPQVVSGQKVSEIIKRFTNRSDLARLKKEHLNYLNSIHNILF